MLAVASDVASANFEKSAAVRRPALAEVARFAVMVNSGSSANLLAVSASCNPLRDTKFYPGDEAIIPVLCWSTSLWPLVQFGLKPIFNSFDELSL